jgi:hypothetical protein
VKTELKTVWSAWTVEFLEVVSAGEEASVLQGYLNDDGGKGRIFAYAGCRRYNPVSMPILISFRRSRLALTFGPLVWW